MFVKCLLWHKPAPVTLCFSLFALRLLSLQLKISAQSEAEGAAIKLPMQSLGFPYSFFFLQYTDITAAWYPFLFYSEGDGLFSRHLIGHGSNGMQCIIA